MKIKKLKVSNFRNLRKINVNFGNINIITGKNSTGKTNLIQIISHSLETDDKVKNFFGENIVTIGPGLNSTTIETTIYDFNRTIQQVYHSEKNIFCYNPEEIRYKNKISKKLLSSKEQEIHYKGYYLVNDSLINKKEEVIKEKNFINDEVFKKIFENNIENKIVIDTKNRGFYDIFENLTENKIINFNNNLSYGNCIGQIYNFVVKNYFNDKYKDIINLLNRKDFFPGNQEFKEASLIDLLADLQRNKNIFLEFNNDLNYFSDGIIKKIEINTDGSKGFKGGIFIETPYGPKDIEYLSAGSAIILYFVVLKNWLKLERRNTSYSKPDIMLFDELDSVIHPSLIGKFTDLLKEISSDVQIFITTHSTNFIDCFDLEDIYLLKDLGNIGDKIRIKSNILSYKKIIESIKNEDEINEFKNISPSKLYIEGYLETLFPFE